MPLDLTLGDVVIGHLDRQEGDGYGRQFRNENRCGRSNAAIANNLSQGLVPGDAERLKGLR